MTVPLTAGRNHEVEITFVTPIQEFEDQVGLDFTVPSASANELQLDGLASSVSLERIPGTMPAKREGARVVASWGASTDVRLRWREADSISNVVTTPKMALFYVLQMDRSLITGGLMVQMRLEDVGRSAQQLRLEVPANLVPRRVAGSGMFAWDWQAARTPGGPGHLILDWGPASQVTRVVNLSLSGARG